MPIPLIKLELIEIPIRPLVRHLPQLGVHIPATQQELHLRIVLPHVFRDLERTDKRPRKGTRDANNGRLHLVHRRLQVALKWFVHHPAAINELHELSEIIDHAALRLGIA